MDSKDQNEFYYVFKWSKNYFYVSNDDVYCFGSNICGELGLGHKKEVNEWTIIPELCNKQIIGFNNGLWCCTALSREGKVYTFGKDDYQLGHKVEEMESINCIQPKPIETLENEFIEQVSCGCYHTLVLTRNQEVYGWGHNGLGQIGINSKEITKSIAVNIKGFNDEKIQSISCGSDHSMALTVNGNVFSWGRNDCGQLGINSTEHSYSPQMIKFSDETVLFKGISCGYYHSLLLSKNGDIYSFGSNSDNQLGYKTCDDKQLIPQRIAMKLKINFREIFCHSNEDFSTGLTSNYKLCYIWGKCGVKGKIESPEKTEYNSCIKAVNSFIPIDFPMKEIKSKIETANNYFENTSKEIKRLGSGGFGEVFEAENKANKRCFAIKKIHLSGEQYEEGKEWREIEFLSTLKSEYVVEYENAWIETDKQSNNDYILYIQMELCSKTLKELNKELVTELQCKQSLIENRIGFYIVSELLTEVIEGVNYLHKNNIIHRDLKPENILISDFKKGRIVRISDFGISCIHRTKFIDNEYISISHTDDVGDRRYIAPELLVWSYRPSGYLLYNYKVDIYSLGKIFNELTLANNRINIDSFDDSLKSKLQSLKQITEKMISKSPEDRPDCKELLKNVNKYFMTILDFNEFEDICDNFQKDESEYNLFYIKYIENKLFYHLVCGKIPPQNIYISFSNILRLPKFESYHNGEEYIIARTVDGKLYSFGSNEFNQLGYKTDKEYNYRPKLIEGLKNENVTQVSGGAHHSIALTVKGSVYCWGSNYHGQLGLSNQTAHELIVEKNTEFNGEKVVSLSCGSYHSIALTDKGNVFGWGHNNCGQLGVKNNSHVFHPNIIEVNETKTLFKKIFCNEFESLLLSTNDDIYVFGFNQFNQYENERPDDQILITQMIDKRHPLITFPENKSNFIPSLPMLGLCKLWLESDSVSSSECLAEVSDTARIVGVLKEGFGYDSSTKSQFIVS